MNSKTIGRVINVDNFRVTIELNQELKSLFKSGFDDIYEIARINSYIVLPVADEKVIALITNVRLDNDPDLKSLAGSVVLPKSKRYLVATMVGTINNDEFIQGVNNYPILDNQVWYVTERELEIVFDSSKKATKIELNNSFYLPIGTSASFMKHHIKVNPDKLFGKHLAVIGNTGSGKSCSVATILQSLFSYNYPKNNKLKHSNIIIFDTNGEYKKAFEGLDEVRCKIITADDLKIPYWYMNWDDFDYLFRPQPGTQAPILKRAIALSKFKTSKIIENSDPALNKLFRLIDLLESNNSDLKRFVINELDDLVGYYQSKNENIHTELQKLVTARSTGNLTESYGIKGDISTKVVIDVLGNLNRLVSDYLVGEENNKAQIDIDLPIPFDFNYLITQAIDDAIAETSSNNRYKEYLSSLILRLRSYKNDERFNKFFLFDKDFGTGSDFKLTTFLEKIMGLEDNSRGNITIIDMSLLPYEILENVTGLIGRLILEFLQRIQKVPEADYVRGELPILMVLEEAQNYIPERNKDIDRVSISKRIFERISREGRKYGLGLLLSSQRPSELSKTILSQCNSFVVHRLQNPDDQRYIKQIVSSSNEDLLNQLPVLPPQHAIVMGECVRSPLQVKLRNVNPKPESSNPKFVDKWISGTDINIDKVVKIWTQEEK